MASQVDVGRQMAAKVRREHFVSALAPIDPSWLAERIGLIVIRRPMPSDLSGVHFSHPGGKSFVAVNSSDTALRQNFTLAHEIAHHFFDGDQTIAEKITGSEKTPVEVRANAFAAHLLLPDDALDAWSAIVRTPFDQNDIARLAVRYRLSYLATLYRLKNHGTISGVDDYTDRSTIDPTLRGILNARTESFEVPSIVAKMADEALRKHVISKRRHEAILNDLERDLE